MKKLLIALSLLTFSISAAQAEVLVWKDPQYDIKVTYPDNWMRQAQLDQDMRLFVLAPQGADHAACRLYVRHDGRFMDAPAASGQDIANFIFTADEIKNEIFIRRDTDMIQLASHGVSGSLGTAAAVTAQASFQKLWAGQIYPMRALIMATQYHGDRIFMSCETLATAWPRWEETMKEIFKSVSFPSAFAPEPNGLYDRFQDDGGVGIYLNRRSDGITLH